MELPRSTALRHRTSPSNFTIGPSITGTTLNVGSVTVSYNGTTLATTSITAHQILLTLPDGAAPVGFGGPFTVTTRDGSANSSNFAFTLKDGDGDLGQAGGDSSIFSDTDNDGF